MVKLKCQWGGLLIQGVQQSLVKRPGGVTAVTVLELLDIIKGLWEVTVGGPPVQFLAIYITSKRMPLATFTVDTRLSQGCLDIPKRLGF